ncbi:hypothetical protein [Peribacillus phoenicis]|uniref:hypothetical protein n=1 Tax=unclassified Peribacillus TaxID=2675266 RepID=UPI0039A3D1A9
MKLKRLLRIGIFLLFSILIIFDYFPNIVFNAIPKTTLTIGIISLALIYIVINRGNAKESENSLILEAVFIFYTLVLLVVLTLMGGKSNVGISLKNPILWFVLLLTIADMTLRYRKFNA